MKPIKTATNDVNYILEGCRDLPATRYETEQGKTGIESCWELEPGELEQIQKTGKVYLYIMGDMVPPVLLTTESCLIFPEQKGAADDSDYTERKATDGKGVE